MTLPTPLSKIKLLERIERAIKQGGVILSGHIREEMEEENFGTPDILHVLKRRKGLNVKREWHPEYEAWRYRVSGNDPEGLILTVVVAVPEEDQGLPEDRIMIITAFYKN